MPKPVREYSYDSLNIFFFNYPHGIGLTDDMVTHEIKALSKDVFLKIEASTNSKRLAWNTEHAQEISVNEETYTVVPLKKPISLKEAIRVNKELYDAQIKRAQCGYSDAANKEYSDVFDKCCANLENQGYDPFSCIYVSDYHPTTKKALENLEERLSRPKQGLDTPIEDFGDWSARKQREKEQNRNGPLLP